MRVWGGGACMDEVATLWAGEASPTAESGAGGAAADRPCKRSCLTAGGVMRVGRARCGGYRMRGAAAHPPGLHPVGWASWLRSGRMRAGWCTTTAAGTCSACEARRGWSC